MRFLLAAILAATVVGAYGIVSALIGASQAELGPEEAETAFARPLALGRYVVVIVAFVLLGRYIGRSGGLVRDGALWGGLAGFAGAVVTAGAIAFAAGGLLGSLVRESADPGATTFAIAMGFLFTQLIGAAEGALITMVSAHLSFRPPAVARA